MMHDAKPVDLQTLREITAIRQDAMDMQRQHLTRKAAVMGASTMFNAFMTWNAASLLAGLPAEQAVVSAVTVMGLLVLFATLFMLSAASCGLSLRRLLMCAPMDVTAAA